MLKEYTMANEENKIMIDRFVSETEKLLGKEVWEKPLWNTCVSRDAVSHFMRGIGDDNPLYLDPDYGQKSSLGRQLAPPTFLTSVLYPIFHGASMSVPLWFLVGEVTYHWFLPIEIGDNLRATIKPIDLFDTVGSFEDRKIFIVSETCYVNQNDLIVGKCVSTTVCVPENKERLLVERSIYEYSEEEIENMAAALEKETLPVIGSFMKMNSKSDADSRSLSVPL